jgi:hypothetical protein
MLCEICRRGLEGISDPTATPRVDIVSQPAQQENDVCDLLEVERYVYGHHRTRRSLLDSHSIGCCICFQTTQSFRRGGKLEDRGPSREHFTTFKVKVQGERIRVIVMCDDLEGCSDLVPVGDKAYDENMAFTLDDTTDSPRTRKRVNDWVSNCTAHHELCAQRTTFLPTRVIKINGHHRPRTYCLVSRDECPPNSRYVTLSYMWGTRPLESRTRLLVPTFEGLRQNNPVQQLSKTFRDAMEVALRFSVHYIWIDSLCIIQDSSEDWQKEANTMQDVYRNSYLNVSAVSSSDDTIGLYFARDPSEIVPTVVHLDISGDGKTRPFRHDAEKGWAWSTRWHKDGKTLDRGWCVQERLLAPRTVHFGASQIFWECRQQAACEVNPQNALNSLADRRYLWKPLLGSPKPPAPTSPYRQIFLDWYVALSLYAKCSVTVPTDRLIALSGLANDLKRTLRELYPNQPHHYLAGLWEEDLRVGLCWFTSDYGQRSSQYLAPSWSWASLYGATGQTGVLDETEYTWLVDESECTASTVFVGGADTGRVQNGSLALTGSWLSIPFDGPQVPGRPCQRLLTSVFSVDSPEELSLPLPDNPTVEHKVSFDVDEALPQQGFCIPILARSHDREDTALRWQVRGLVVLPLEGLPVFRRVGLLQANFSSEEAVLRFVERFRRRSITVV